jgi:hypothetical protein
LEKNNRFKHNLSLEYALCDLLGKTHYSKTAGDFKSQKYCQKYMFNATNKIRERLSDIPMDERLTMRTGAILDTLERHLNENSDAVNTDWDIITDLLHLLVHLLGYDWQDGRVHRELIYHQSIGQEQEDWKMQVGDSDYYDSLRKEEKRRYMLVKQLIDNKIPKYQIAKLLGLAIKRVNRILCEIDAFEQGSGKKLDKFG